MKISYSKFRIHLKHTFGISRSRNDWYDIAFIYIIDGNIIGRGEVAPSLRYNESIERVLSILNKGIELPGVNIIVKGTYYGSSSDLEGRYRLNDISPGSYDIEVSMIGYKIILKTGVLVEAGKTITIDFKMEKYDKINC